MFWAMRCLAFEAGLRFANDVSDVVLPFERDAAGVRLIADFVVEIIELLQLSHDLAHHGFLNCQQTHRSAT